MKIEDLYSTSLNSPHTYNGNNVEWIKIETELKRKEFYTFSFYQFNIYYAGILMLNLLVSAWGISTHLNHSHETNFHKTIDPIQQLKDDNSSSIVSSTKIESTKNNINTPSERPFQETLNKKPTRKTTPTTKETIITIPLTDSTQNKTDSTIFTETIIQTETPILPHLKDTVIIHKQDTIYHIDSIKVSSRKWKKINKK